jgi:hypothetical protein
MDALVSGEPQVKKNEGEEKLLEARQRLEMLE